MTITKRFLALGAMILLALPTTALADSVDFAFVGGTVWAIAGPALQAASTLTQAGLLPLGPSFAAALPTGLGSVSITTGTLASGTLAAGATFSPGGTVTIVANGTWGGLAAGTTLYTGTFSGTTNWAQLGTNYNLSGPLRGSVSPAFIDVLIPGGCAGCSLISDGALFSLTVPGSVPFTGSAAISSGNISAAVPEPGTIALVGTGLIGIAGVIRRKFFA